MSNWFKASFGYGLGAAVGRAIFGGGDERRKAPSEPIIQQTEAEIRAAEKRYDAEARQLDADDKAASTGTR